MPLNVRSISTNAAVIFFFAIAIVGWTSKLSALTCCKRAIIAAIIAYVAATIALKAINAIFINAMVTRQITSEKENNSDRKD